MRPENLWEVAAYRNCSRTVTCRESFNSQRRKQLCYYDNFSLFHLVCKSALSFDISWEKLVKFK